MIEEEKEIAIKLLKDAYTRWCYEISDEKNVLTAKDIALYIVEQLEDLEKQMIGYKGPKYLSKKYEKVRKEINQNGRMYLHK